MYLTKHGVNMENPFVAPFKTGFVNNVPPLKAGEKKTVEYPFEWLDGNPDDEDRNGYGVSLEEGKLVIGGRAMGVTTRVDDYDPSVQWVAVGGFVDVRATRIDGNTGYLDQDGRMYATKKLPKFSRGRLGIVMEVLTPPKYRTYMYKRNVCEEEGTVRVLLW